MFCRLSVFSLFEMWLTNNKIVSIRQTSPVKSAHFQIQLLGRFEYSTTDINNLAIAVFVENPISIAISLTLYNNRIRYFRGFVNRPRFVFICVFLHAGLEKTVIIVFFFATGNIIPYYLNAPTSAKTNLTNPRRIN